MKTRTMLRALCAAAMLLAVAQALPSLAQTPSPTPTAEMTPPPFISITVVSVKPDKIAEFQDFMKSTTNPALKKGGLKWRAVWQSTAAAGDAFEYVLVAPVNSFAEFDGASALEKALGAQGFAAWQAKAGSLVTSVHRYITRPRPDLSFEGKRSGPPKLAVVTMVHAAPNRNNDLENYIKNDFLPVMKQANVTYQVSQTIFGGNANTYVALALRESFAELDKGSPVTQTLGAEGAQKLADKLPAGTVTHVERSIARFVTELSFMQ